MSKLVLNLRGSRCSQASFTVFVYALDLQSRIYLAIEQQS